VWLGQDANWDLRNYHLYSVHAWLTGRMAVDLAPSQLQTWLNPLSHLPAYVLITSVSPVLAGAALGGLAGVNGLLVWLLSRRMAGYASRARFLTAGLATAAALTGSVFISFLGTSFSENLCSPLVLGALLCLVPHDEEDAIPSKWGFLGAGVCLGAACGLKLTHLVYAMGMTAALAVLWPFYRLRLQDLARFAAGGIAAFVLVGGYWTAKLWLSFGSPMFPFFNAVFRSPWFEPVNFADTRFLPSSLLHAAVSYPFAWLVGAYPTSELPFREPRFALVAVLLPVATVAAAMRSRSWASFERRERGGWNFWICSVFFSISYLIWLKQFGIQRYVLPLEMLTGVILVLCLLILLRGAKEVAVALGMLVVGAGLWTQPPNWERVPYGPDWFGFSFVEEAVPTLYVMTGGYPTSYAILHLSPAHRFVRLGGNMPLEPGQPFGRRAAEIIAGFEGPVRTLSGMPIDEAERSRLRRFGLDLRPESCRTYRSRMDTFWTCELNRSARSQ
jgi:hypothetical protein